MFFPRNSKDFLDAFRKAIFSPEKLGIFDYTAIQLLRKYANSYPTDSSWNFLSPQNYHTMLFDLLDIQKRCYILPDNILDMQKLNITIECVDFLLNNRLTSQHLDILKLHFQKLISSGQANLQHHAIPRLHGGTDGILSVEIIKEASHNSYPMRDDSDVLALFTSAIRDFNITKHRNIHYGAVEQIYLLHGTNASDNTRQQLWDAIQQKLAAQDLVFFSREKIQCDNGETLSKEYIEAMQQICVAFCKTTTNPQHAMQIFLNTPIENKAEKVNFVADVAKIMMLYEQNIAMDSYFLAVVKFFTFSDIDVAKYYIARYILDSYISGADSQTIQRDICKILATNSHHISYTNVRKMVESIYCTKIDDSIKSDIYGYILDHLLSHRQYIECLILLDHTPQNSQYLQNFARSPDLRLVLKVAYDKQDIYLLSRFAQILHITKDYNLLYNTIENKAFILQYDALFNYVIDDKKNICKKAIESVLQCAFDAPGSVLQPNVRPDYGPEDKITYKNKLEKLLRAALKSHVDVSATVSTCLQNYDWDHMKCSDREKVLLGFSEIKPLLQWYLQTVDFKDHSNDIVDVGQVVDAPNTSTNVDIPMCIAVPIHVMDISNNNIVYTSIEVANQAPVLSQVLFPDVPTTQIITSQTNEGTAEVVGQCTEVGVQPIDH